MQKPHAYAADDVLTLLLYIHRATIDTQENPAFGGKISYSRHHSSEPLIHSEPFKPVTGSESRVKLFFSLIILITMTIFQIVCWPQLLWLQQPGNSSEVRACKYFTKAAFHKSGIGWRYSSYS